MQLGYNKTKSTESLWWESNECTKEEWGFLCKLFGQDPEHTMVLKIEYYTVETFTVEQVVKDHCLSEDSIFTD